MQIIIEEFKDSCFLYAFKKHIVKNVKIVNGNAVIKTDRKTFVKTQTELEEFYNDVKFVDEDVVDLNKEYVPVVSENTSLNAEIIQANSLTGRLTNSLEEIFNELAYGDPTDKTYRKAEAMVRATNAIVSVQLANYKYLSLNK